MKKITVLFFLLFGVLSFFSCNEDEYTYDDELTLLYKYLENEDIEVNDNNLYYIPLKTGIGEACVKDDVLHVTYTGWYIESETKLSEFDSNDGGDDLVFQIGQNIMIQGWEKLILGMRAGDEAKLIMSSQDGYGSTKVGTIPPYSSLIFNVTINSIEKK